MTDMMKRSDAIIYWDGKQNCYVAVSPLMIPCEAYGDTPQKALEALEQELAGSTDAVQEMWQPAPQPFAPTPQQPESKWVDRRRPGWSIKQDEVVEQAVEMVVTREDGDDFSVIAVIGEMDRSNANIFKEVFTAVINEKECHVVLNLAKTTYTDLAAIGTWLGCTKTLRKVDKSLVFASVPTPVERMFPLSGLYTVFPRFRSVEDAVASLHDPAKMNQATSKFPY